MLHWFQKNSGLVLDEPAITLTKDFELCKQVLQNARVSYEADSDGLITFMGKAFGAAFPLIFKLHEEGNRVKFVEICRPAAMDARASYEEMSAILKKRFGHTLLSSASVTRQLPSEQWYRKGMTISHFMLERMGPEEFLYILFK